MPGRAPSPPVSDSPQVAAAAKLLFCTSSAEELYSTKFNVGAFAPALLPEFSALCATASLLHGFATNHRNRNPTQHSLGCFFRGTSNSKTAKGSGCKFTMTIGIDGSIKSKPHEKNDDGEIMWHCEHPLLSPAEIERHPDFARAKLANGDKLAVNMVQELDEIATSALLADKPPGLTALATMLKSHASVKWNLELLREHFERICRRADKATRTGINGQSQAKALKEALDARKDMYANVLGGPKESTKVWLDDKQRLILAMWIPAGCEDLFDLTIEVSCY